MIFEKVGINNLLWSTCNRTAAWFSKQKLFPNWNQGLLLEIFSIQKQESCNALLLLNDFIRNFTTTAK